MQGGEDETVEQTVIGLRMMTPGYASPEQALGLPVTTATDVYSLGAVLYEVLAGRPPHQWEGLTPSEVERAICRRHPEPPSAVAPKTRRKALSGDLDNIVLMALRKEPARRYATADQLAADLQRALDHRPVRARPDTLRYRAGKFLRRNRISLAAAAVLSASLVGGTAISIWQARRAERRFELVRKLAGALIYDIHDEIRDLAGSTKARQKIVSTGLEYLGALEREAAGDPNLQWDLAGAYLRIGEVQGGTLGANLGDRKGALESYRKALALLAGLRVTPETTRQVAAMEAKIADVLLYYGDLTGSTETYRRAQALIEPMAQRNGSVEARRQLASILQGVARAQGQQRDVAGAQASALKVLEIRRELAETEKTADSLSSLADAEAELSMALQRDSRPQEALPHARKALEIRLAQAEANRNNSSTQRGLILSYSHVADVLGNPTMPSLGDTAGAIEMYRKMTAVAEGVAASDPADRRARYDLANCLLRLGSALASAGAAEEGIAAMERSASLLREIAAAEPKNNRARANLAFLYMRIGDALASRQAARAAVASYQKAIDLGIAVITAAPDERTIRVSTAQSYSGQGLALASLGDAAGAIQAGTRAVEETERSLRENPANSRARYNVAERMYAMSQIHRKLGDRAMAGGPVCTWLAKADAMYPKDAQELAATDRPKVEAVKRELAACGTAGSR
jgi:tetratricopeptide (TPR) repeat protein